MTVRQAATTAEFQSAVNASASGDIVELTGANYTSCYGRAGITVRSAGLAPWMAVTGTRGYRGQGMPTRIAAPIGNYAGMTWQGIFFDTRGYAGINHAYQDQQDVTVEDCAFAARRSDGGRSILFTLYGGGGMNFVLRRSRVSGCGQAGNMQDHSIYAKKTWYSGGYTSRSGTRGYLIEQSIFEDVSGFVLHGYTQGSGGVFRKNVAVRCGSLVTFSAADQAGDSSTGWWGATSCVDVENCLSSDKTSSASFYHVDWYDAHSTLDPADNWVRNTGLYRGAGTTGRLKPGGGTRYQTAGAILGSDSTSPGYRDASNGDLTLEASSAAYLDANAASIQVGPDSIQPGFGGGGGGGGGGTPGAFGTGTPATFTDTFSYADGTLTTLNSAWQAGPWVSDGSLSVSSGKVVTGEADGSFSNNMHTTVYDVVAAGGLDFILDGVTHPSAAATRYARLYVLHSAPGAGSTHNGYLVTINAYTGGGNDQTVLTKMVAGTESAALITGTAEWVAGAGLGLRVMPDGKISLWKTVSGVWTQIGSEVTDTTFTTGRVGVMLNGSGSSIDGIRVLPAASAKGRARFGASMGV